MEGVPRCPIRKVDENDHHATINHWTIHWEPTLQGGGPLDSHHSLANQTTPPNLHLLRGFFHSRHSFHGNGNQCAENKPRRSFLAGKKKSGGDFWFMGFGWLSSWLTSWISPRPGTFIWPTYWKGELPSRHGFLRVSPDSWRIIPGLGYVVIGSHPWK